jgi:hypothetical protein
MHQPWEEIRIHCDALRQAAQTLTEGKTGNAVSAFQLGAEPS